MNLIQIVIRRSIVAARQARDAIARRLRNNFYLYLAAALSLFVVVDALTLRAVVDMRQRTYDLMIRYRIFKPEPDPRIVIVDVNEASLAAMAKDYGRWPWPRQVLGEFVERVQEQQPQSIVFDVLFSDPDVFNPDSDAYFNEVIAGTTNTYFPMLRLAPDSDRLSELKPSMVPGAARIEGARESGATVAMVLPHFQAVLEGGRLGTHNIYPEPDGVVRRYRLWHEEDGWRLPSLPLRVALDRGAGAPGSRDILLNWRGKPFTYDYVTFSDVFFDMQRKERSRPPDEFRDRIVIIGSTAPGLFDIKPTSMARAFPGVEILATAIDNLEHRDWIRTPASPWPNALIALLIVWATAISLYRNPDSDRFNGVFGLSQAGLMVFSYATINFTSYFINLTGPVFIGLIFYSVARVYSTATARVLERSAVAQTLQSRGGRGATLLLVQLRADDFDVPPRFVRKLRSALLAVGTHAKDVEIVKGRQRGVWGLLETALAVTWAHSLDDDRERAQVAQDVGLVRQRLPELVARLRVNDEEVAALSEKTTALGGDDREQVQARWRLLLAEALAEINRDKP
jgi:CHASE2 domain-containing sensor protein